MKAKQLSKENSARLITAKHEAKRHLSKQCIYSNTCKEMKHEQFRRAFEA